MSDNFSTKLIDILHKQSLEYEAKLELLSNRIEQEQLKGVILGLKEAIEIIAKEDRSRTIKQVNL